MLSDVKSNISSNLDGNTLSQVPTAIFMSLHIHYARGSAINTAAFYAAVVYKRHIVFLRISYFKKNFATKVCVGTMTGVD